jgi:hypothetical protein
LKNKRDVATEEQTILLTRRLQSQLSNFKNENKIFKGRFMFDNVDYYLWVPDLEEQLVSGDFYLREKMKAIEEEAKKQMEKERERMEREAHEREEERRREEEERKVAEEMRRKREEEERRKRAVEVALQTSEHGSVKEEVTQT